MFGSDILDIAIGLVLVYLIFSILMTSITEAIEGVLKTRAGDLEHAIWQLVQGDHDLLDQFYNHPLIYGLYRDDYRSRNPNPAPVATGATPAPPQTPMKSRKFTNLPSYIPREVFSAAMIDVLKNTPNQASQLHAAFEAAAPSLAAVVDKKVIDPAMAAAQHANSELTRKRKALEDWFDGAMDRASGIFKRRTQVRLFVVGLGIALVCNVNSVVIAQYLATHKPALEAMVTLAEQAQTDAPKGAVARAQPAAAAAAAPADNAAVSADSAVVVENAGAEEAGNASAAPATDAASAARDAWLRSYQDQLRGVGLPIGWSEDTAARVGAMFPGKGHPMLWFFALLTLAVGYLATAFAVMLGAPFWFDLLGRLMVVRSTVKPDQKSKDDPPITS